MIGAIEKAGGGGYYQRPSGVSFVTERGCDGGDVVC